MSTIEGANGHLDELGGALALFLVSQSTLPRRYILRIERWILNSTWPGHGSFTLRRSVIFRPEIVAKRLEYVGLL